MLEYITSAKGKIDLVDTPIDSMETKTLKIETGVESGIIAIDVDYPNSEENRRLLKYISRNDLFIISSQYTLDDVFNGKCRYKVLYRYNSDKELSNPRTKKNDDGEKISQPVEIFYAKKKKVSVIGERHDGYMYKMIGRINDLHFDIQDVVSYKIKTKMVNKKQGNENIKRKKKEEFDIKELPDNVEEVNAKEFTQIITRIMGDCPTISKKNKNLLTFPCLFPKSHTSRNNAYAFKKGGHYVAKCQGLVCDGEYQNLNNTIKEDYIDSVDFKFKGFDIDESKGEKVKLFIAPTSYGKTEKIAQEVLNTITTNTKLLVVCQSIEAIERLKNRINWYSKGALPTLEMNGKIFTWISENNDSHLEQNFIKSNVILTHHYYLANAGSVLTYYPALQQVLSQPNLRLIVDEAHTWLELASQLSIEAGGLYKEITNGRYIENRDKLTKKQRELKGDKLKDITGCLEPTLTDFGTIDLRKQYKKYSVVDYVDLVGEIKKRFEPKVDSKVDNGTNYTLYKNPNPKPIQANKLDDCNDVLNLILGPSEYVIVSKLEGDETPRKTIGRYIVNIYHYQLLKMIFDRVEHTILTTATFTDYHYNCLSRTCNFDEIRIDNPLKKIDKVVLLTKTKDTQVRIRKQIMNNLNETNARALLFMPTINNAKTLATKYDNFILNDNGWYSIMNRVSQEDYIDNYKRNAIICGLESSVAKGYNFMEEVGEDAEGFDIVYFDSEPVSPDVLKKYVGKDENIEDYYDTYAMNTFTQAIGRALRKEKKQMTICLNNISEKLTEAIIKYLRLTLNCEIIRDELSLTNLKVSTLKDMEDNETDLSENKLYKKLYLDEREDNSE